MILGMSTETYTFFHVLLSLVGIASGLLLIFGLLAGQLHEGMSALFLVTTVATSVTGFGFPFEHLLPSHIVGIISLVILAVVIPARYVFHLAGGWRLTYVIGSATALYLNVFVLVVQAFIKVPSLRALAPTQKEPPFLFTQLLVFAIFVGLTIGAVRRFRIEPEIEQEEDIERPRAA
jgi:hypothetical protein